MDAEVKKFQGQSEVLEAVLGLEKKNFSKADSWTDILRKEVKRQNTALLYVLQQDKVVGYIIYTTNRLTVHISKVAVDKTHRRQGLARQLVQACLQTAKQERKVSWATLHVDPMNTAAKTLYQGLDFKIDGVLQDYYAHGRPSWKMLKQLDQPF